MPLEAPPLPSRGTPDSPLSSSSFRDPGGHVVDDGDRVLRVITDARAAEDLRAFLETPLAREAALSGRLVRTSPASVDAGSMGAALVVEHERVVFPSYPYEWPPEMLGAAAALTLDLAEEALDLGFGLKDATPYNVLFRGPSPVFIDLLSFERRDARDATWLAYAQLVRTFLLPLIAAHRYGLSIAASLGAARDGLEPEQVHRLTGPFEQLLPPLFGLVTLPTWLGRRAAGAGSVYEPKLLDDPERARFILKSLLRSCRRSLARAAGGLRAKRSPWMNYADRAALSGGSAAAKRALVERVLGSDRPAAVLDVGCNTGEHSLIAAEIGARVVAIDVDPDVVGEVWRKATEARKDVLPLVVDIARPSPAIGWRNREQRSFLDRSRGHFDAVLMLALVHHLAIHERVSLPAIADLCAELTHKVAIVEHVGPEDPMFRALLRGRDPGDLSREAFEAAFGARFDIEHREDLRGADRRVYVVRRRGGGP